jgi:hypothetical protein
VYSEGDLLVTSADNVATLTLGILGLVILGVTWKMNSATQLRRTNNILFVPGLWLLVFSIFGYEIEAGFPEDIADDILKILISLALVANRFF